MEEDEHGNYHCKDCLEADSEEIEETNEHEEEKM
jgi:hypothetical protein